MSCIETPLVFGCDGQALLGIVSCPPVPAELAVVIVVGGPQYRAGSHRQFVLLARRLAEAGHAVLRFDARGMGDSTGELRNFEHLVDDIGCALEAFQRHLPGLRRFVLWGLCDGASAALLYMDEQRDPRVHGLVLLNPWVRSQAVQARTRVKHYYTRRVLQREFWAKLLSGRVAAGALGQAVQSAKLGFARGAAADVPPAAYQQRMLAAWSAFDGPVLLILSGNDYTAKEFIEFSAGDRAWQQVLARASTSRRELADADHTFSERPASLQVEALTLGLVGEAAR